MVSFDSYGLTTIQDDSYDLPAGVIISVPVRITESGTIFGARLNTITANGDFRMALYSYDGGRPGNLLANSEPQAVVKGVNTALMIENFEAEDEWYYLCFVFSTTEEVTFKSSAYLDSGYTRLDYSLPWEDPMYDKPENLDALFNAWILVK